jgi:hypothetical protein
MFIVFQRRFYFVQVNTQHREYSTMIKRIALLLIISSMFVHPVMGQTDVETTFTTSPIVKDANALTYSPFTLELFERTQYDVFAGASCKKKCDDGTECSINCSDGKSAFCSCPAGGAYCYCETTSTSNTHE